MNPKNYLLIFVLIIFMLYILPVCSYAQNCPSVITDKRDGRTYKTIKLGGQCWMAENLNVGKMIDSKIDQSNDGNIEKYCWENTIENCDKYGGLYQWDEMMNYADKENSQGICPSGWHIPSLKDWQILKKRFGANAGINLKQGGTSGFEALLSGLRCEELQLVGINIRAGGFITGFFGTKSGFYWTSSNLGYKQAALYLRIDDSDGVIGEYFDVHNVFSHKFGFSVRCIKD